MCTNVGFSVRLFRLLCPRPKTLPDSGLGSRGSIHRDLESLLRQPKPDRFFAVSTPTFVRVVRSMLSPAPKQFERPDHSNTPALVHHSSARVAHKGRPHPNGILSSHSSRALAGLSSAFAIRVSSPATRCFGSQN